MLLWSRKCWFLNHHTNFSVLTCRLWRMSQFSISLTYQWLKSVKAMTMHERYRSICVQLKSTFREQSFTVTRQCLFNDILGLIKDAGISNYRSKEMYYMYWIISCFHLFLTRIANKTRQCNHLVFLLVKGVLSPMRQRERVLLCDRTTSKQPSWRHRCLHYNLAVASQPSNFLRHRTQACFGLRSRHSVMYIREDMAMTSISMDRKDIAKSILKNP